MNKKISFLTIIIILIAIFSVFVIENYHKDFAVISCTNTDGNCYYKEKNALGNVKYETEFNFKEIMQCNIETIYKKDVKDRDTVYAYDFYLYFINADKKEINFKTKQRENLDKICGNFFEKKPFEYKFPLLKE